jgi:large subunit ribosomal protein L27e
MLSRSASSTDIRIRLPPLVLIADARDFTLRDLGTLSQHALVWERQVAIILQGRQAGHKVIVIRQLDEGTKERPYPHAIVAGVERYPLKVTKRMGAKKLARRSKVKPFIKVSWSSSTVSPLLSAPLCILLLSRISFITSPVLILVQVVNYSHLFPTRYALELEGLKGSVSSDTFKEVSQREDAKKTIKKLLEDRYQGGKNKWFFTPLRVSSAILPSCFPGRSLMSGPPAVLSVYGCGVLVVLLRNPCPCMYSRMSVLPLHESLCLWSCPRSFVCLLCPL